MRRLLLSAVWLAACDGAFDLTPVHTEAGTTCRDPQQLTTDEDDDGVLDGCDNCPAVGNADQTDSDGDEVGDECDPHVDEPRDHIAFFDGFASGSLDPRWEGQGTGTWQQDGGSLRQTISDRSNSGLLILRRTFANASVEVLFTGQLPESPDTSVGVWAAIPPGTQSNFPPGVLCFSYMSNTYGHLIVVEVYPGQKPKNQTKVPDGEVLRLRGSTDGSCTAVRDQLARVTTTITDPFIVLDGEIGLRVGGTPAEFRSVTVFEADAL